VVLCLAAGGCYNRQKIVMETAGTIVNEMLLEGQCTGIKDIVSSDENHFKAKAIIEGVKRFDSGRYVVDIEVAVEGEVVKVGILPETEVEIKQ